MKVLWSIPIRGERLGSGRGDLVRAHAMIEALRAEGHDVHAVVDGDRASARAEVLAYRSVVRRLLPRRGALALRDISRTLRARGHARRVVAAGTAQGADVIVETQVHFTGSGMLAARALGVPLVLDDCSPWSEVETLGAGAPGLARRVFRRQAEAADLLVVSSPRLRTLLTADGIPAPKVRVVPNGVRPPRRDRDDRDAVRSRLGAAKSVVVGFVGSFQPWHRVDLLVEAAARLGPAPANHLLLIGDGVGRPEALRLAARRGLAERLTAVGAVAPDAVPGLLSACDIGVLPASNDYGQPMKLLEYAAAGVATVAPNLPPVRELVEHGTTGLLFPPGDVEALHATLARLVSDRALRERLGAAARACHASGHAWRDRARDLAAELAPLQRDIVRREAVS